MHLVKPPANDDGYLDSLTDLEMPAWLEGQDAAPEPGEGWDLAGDDGQWDESPAQAVESAGIRRPNFDTEESSAHDVDVLNEFDRAAEELQGAAQVELTLGSPTELGIRAILDRATGSRVPVDHGGYYHCKSKIVGAPIVYADGQLSFYSPDRGFWVPVDLEDIALNVQEYDGCPYGPDRKDGSKATKTIGNGEVESALRCGLRRVTYKDFFEVSKRVPGLCMRDGFWRMQGGDIVFSPHSAAHRSQFGYDFAMLGVERMKNENSWNDFRDVSPVDPWWASICPVWHWLVSSCLPGQEAEIRFLQELIAASLTGQATQYQRGALLLGKPGAGKSTLIAAIESMFPRGSVAHTDPSSWREDYHRSGLVGKLLNTLEETEKWQAIVPLKQCITGNPFEARFLQMNRFTYKPIAGHIFSTNRLPENVDAAILDRWEVIEFRQRFRGSGLVVAEDRILAQVRRELPGFVLWAFHGWLRLAAQGRYTVPEDSKRIKDGWARDADIVRTFLAQCCEERGDAFVRRSSLWDAFVGWCDRLEVNPKRRIDGLEFKRRMVELGFAAELVGKQNIRAYKGVALRSVEG